MKLLYVTDLHGSRWKYNRLFDRAREFGAGVVINGGDMLPKEGNLFTIQKEFIEDFLPGHFEAFGRARIHYLCFPGNDDLAAYDELFRRTCSRYGFVHDMAQARVEIGGREFIGFNRVVDYPFRLKDRCHMDTRDYLFQEQYGTGLFSMEGGFRESPDWFSHARGIPTIQDELERLVEPMDPARAVYVIHMPPARLGLDRCYNGQEVGSKAVYEFLRKRQPVLSFHGHIHESPEMSGVWKGQIGTTTCIQPGQGDGLTYVTVDLDTMGVERHTENPRRIF